MFSGKQTLTSRKAASLQGREGAGLAQGEAGLILSQWMPLLSPQRPLNLQWPHGVVTFERNREDE